MRWQHQMQGEDEHVAAISKLAHDPVQLPAPEQSRTDDGISRFFFPHFATALFERFSLMRSNTPTRRSSSYLPDLTSFRS